MYSTHLPAHLVAQGPRVFTAHLSLPLLQVESAVVEQLGVARKVKIASTATTLIADAASKVRPSRSGHARASCAAVLQLLVIGSRGSGLEASS